MMPGQRGCCCPRTGNVVQLVATVALLLGPAATAGGCKLVPGRDYLDAAALAHSNASDAAHCCSLCASDASCAVAVYKLSNRQCYTKLGANLPIDRGAASGIVGCLPECTGGRVIPHSDRATAAKQCTGALGDSCAFTCDDGFWPVGDHVCQTVAVGGKAVINASFFGGRCDRLCGGSAAKSCPKGEVPIRSNTTDRTSGTPCLKTVCMSADAALKNVGRGAYEIWRLARNTQTGCIRDHVELGAAAQPDCPGWIGGTGLQLIFECVAVEMGWTTKHDAQAKVIQTLRGLNGKLPGYTMARNQHGLFPVFFNASTGAYLGRPGVRTFTPMDSGFMMGGVLTAMSYFNATDNGSSDTNTIVTLADELWRSTRFDSLLCNKAGLVDPTGTGVPMLQGANASICSATQFPQSDGFYEYSEETYAVWYAYVQACGGSSSGGGGGGDNQTGAGCKDKAMEAMWKAWQGRRTKPNHIYDGHPLLSMWSGYFFQFPYYTVAPVNTDPTYAQLFKQSWLADWAFYNNTANAGGRGRYGLGAGPSPAWCSGGATYIADRIGQQGTLATGMSQCRIYSPYITAGYLPAAPDAITQHLLQLLADGDAVFSVPGTPYHVLWRRSMLDPGWNNNNNDTTTTPVEITMVDLSSLLFGLSTLWLDGFYQTYTNHGWWKNDGRLKNDDDDELRRADDGRSPLILSAGGLAVALDSALPRPATVTFRGADFSPSGPGGAIPPPPPAQDWWKSLDNFALVDKNGKAEECLASAGCTSHPLPASTVKTPTGGAANCSADCVAAGAACAAWSVAKVTPRSGRKVTPLCLLYAPDGLTAKPPFYAMDANFACGSKSQLQPGPPAHGGGGGGNAQRHCIGVLATNGSITEFCAGQPGEVSTTYWYDQESGAAAQTRSWRTVLCKANLGATVELNGTISVGGADSLKATELEFTLVAATSSQISVRGVDFHYAFAGVSGVGDSFFFGRSSRDWTGGPGCGSWGVHIEHGSVPSAELASTSRVPTNSSNDGGLCNWPAVKPWALAALLDTARSNGVGIMKANGAAGVGFFSSQRTLPFRRFVSADGHSVGFGSARINTKLRCGILLPQKLRLGFFTDLTNDGKASADDSVVWTREQYPLADFVYRAAAIMKIDLDISSYKLPWNPMGEGRLRFNETLKYIAKIAAMSDHMPLVLHLVGWSGTGLDSLDPSYDLINPNLGTKQQLEQVKKLAWERYRTIVSYHVDTDNAYQNFTVATPIISACDSRNLGNCWNSTVGHPVPHTNDCQHNPSFNKQTVMMNPGGNFWNWELGSSKPSAIMRTDQCQGPCYRLSKAKDYSSGQRTKRFEALLRTIPITQTVHMDAYRDINDSFESDEAGFIAEDEEMACGCAKDAEFLAQHGLSLGVEGPNGMASVGGTSPPAMDVFSYYWHDGFWLGQAHSRLGVFARIIVGSDQGLDVDIVPAGPHTQPQKSATDPFHNFESLADRFYLKAKPLALQMVDTMLLKFNETSGEKVFANGGNSSHWPHGGDFIEYYRPSVDGTADTVFVPEVVMPPLSASKTAPTTINSRKIFAYMHSGAGAAQTHTFEMPDTWSGQQVSATTITPSERVPGQPEVHVHGRNLTLELTPGRPVVLTVPTRADGVHWSAKQHCRQPGCIKPGA